MGIFSRYANNLIGNYLKIHFDHPYLLILTTFIISTILTGYGIFFNYSAIDFNPVKGFETIGTKLSADRKTLLSLKDIQSKNEDIFRHYFNETNRVKRATPTSTIDSITVNYDDYGVDSVPNIADLEDSCEFYGSIGKSIPYDIIEITSKIIIEISSFENIFDVDVLKHLCHIDDIIDEVESHSDFSTSNENIKHSINLPKYFTCPNSSVPNSCEFINPEMVSNFKDLLELCVKNSSEIVCDAFSINHALNWIFPRNIFANQPTGKVDILVILKTPMWNRDKKRINFYKNLMERLDAFLATNSKTRLVGVSMNTKNEIFQESIYHDSSIGAISALLVFSCFFLYSNSILFTLIIVLIIAFSAGIAFFIYTTIFGISFFPFVNLLVIVILVSIGADDAFLLLTYFRVGMEKLSNLQYQNRGTFITFYQERDLLVRCLGGSLHHSLSSMFLTSITTAITFLTNYFSQIMVLRYFGIYACVTVIVNYILILFVLPSAIIITRPISSFKISKWDSIVSKLSVSSKITSISSKYSIQIIALTILSTIISLISIFWLPGLNLPKYNPIQILSSSNYHEYYDSNIHNFNFEWKRSARFVHNYVIGVDSQTDNMGYFAIPKLQRSNYTINLEKLEKYKDFVDQLISSDTTNYSNYKYVSWADKALKLNVTCLEEKAISDDCILKIIARSHNLVHEFPDDYAVIPGDGPIIDKNFKVIGYFISFPTSQKLRIDTNVTRQVFHDIHRNCNSLKTVINDTLICLSSPEISKFYDILDQLRESSLWSISISMVICLFVIILSTRALKLSIFSSLTILIIVIWTVAILAMLGWKLSVVESTIIIITIGLSFDYTLHYIMAIRDDCSTHLEGRILGAHRSAGIACLYGSATLLMAGFPLLFTRTSSFLQIGTMLFILGITSLLGASIILPAFLFAFSNRSLKIVRM